MEVTLIPPSARKHKFDGIGDATAASALVALAANPSTAFLTSGLSGKIVFWFLSKLFSGLASMGLVLLNVGAEKIIVATERKDYDGSMESAEEFIKAIHATGRELTPEEIKATDDKVIETFRKFAKIARKKK